MLLDAALEKACERACDATDMRRAAGSQLFRGSHPAAVIRSVDAANVTGQTERLEFAVDWASAQGHGVIPCESVLPHRS